MADFLPFYMSYDAEKYIGNRRLQDDLYGNMDRWNEESMSRRDYDYMKSAYPEMAKRIMPYVEAECDRMEYSGSMMFDEYPDQLQMRMLCRRISGRVREQEGKWNEDKWNDGSWLDDLIQVLTFHEIMKRRSEYRKFRRKFY